MLDEGEVLNNQSPSVAHVSFWNNNNDDDNDDDDEDDNDDNVDEDN